MILSGRDLQWYVETGKLKIDPISPEQFQQNGVDLILENMKHMGLPRLRFTGGASEPFNLGCTKETIELPDDLMAFVEIRSTWARRGFFLPPTIVDAGFKGNITLEILHFGTGFVTEPVGKPFAHLIFAKTSSPCVPYSGKYQNQTGITEAKE